MPRDLFALRNKANELSRDWVTRGLWMDSRMSSRGRCGPSSLRRTLWLSREGSGGRKTSLGAVVVPLMTAGRPGRAGAGPWRGGWFWQIVRRQPWLSGGCHGFWPGFPVTHRVKALARLWGTVPVVVMCEAAVGHSD